MQITEIKTSIDILDLAAHLGIEVDKRTGRALCPFHDDKTPSLQFSKDKQICTCFSSNCDAGTMDVIQLVEKKLGLNTHNALKYLAHLAGEIDQPTVPTLTGSIETEGSPTPLKEGVLGRQKKKVEPKKLQKKTSPKDYAVDFEKMRVAFKESPEGRHYLRSRGITSPEILNVTGLSTGNNENVPLKGCVVFPLKDENGDVVSLYGRSMTANSQARHYYTANRQGLYPSFLCRPESSSFKGVGEPSDSSETKRLILTESIIDAATLLQYDFITKDFAVLALYGTNGLTDDHRVAIGEAKLLEDIILFFDGDAAGRAAAEKYTKELSELVPGVKIHTVDTPEGTDINELNQSHDPSVFTHLLQLALSGAVAVPPVNGTGVTGPAPEQGALVTDRVDHLVFNQHGLKAELLGGVSIHQVDRMRVTIKLSRQPQVAAIHSLRHNLDLYNDDQVEKLCRKAADRLEMGTSQLRSFLAELTQQLEDYRLERIEGAKTQKPQVRELTPERRQAATDYLKAENLLSRTNEDIARSGVVGEEVNRLLMYLVFTSRLRDMPLHIISLGASGSGKTYLQERISELIPDDQKLEITTLSDNAFYYFGQYELQNKLILIEDMDGAENVLYPLRELMSKKRISKTLAMKDNKGNLKTITTTVEGPICVSGTTTRERIYEDNANRSLLIYLDGSSRQKEMIMDYQRAVSAGQISYETEEKARELLKDVQSLLKPIKVVNPYAQMLKIPSEVFKPLRTNSHYLQFIECVTFYHQYQRKVKTTQDGSQYIETTLEDIELANELLNGVLISKADELTGACRLFFERLKVHLQAHSKKSFYAKELRSEMRMSYATLKRHLFALVQNGYVKVAGGDKYRKGYEYEVVSYDEYQELQKTIKTALDRALDNIKEK